MIVTDAQLHILRHSLGLDDHGKGNEYRNHYATDPHPDCIQEHFGICCMNPFMTTEELKKFIEKAKLRKPDPEDPTTDKASV